MSELKPVVEIPGHSHEKEDGRHPAAAAARCLSCEDGGEAQCSNLHQNCGGDDRVLAATQEEGGVEHRRHPGRWPGRFVKGARKALPFR